MKYESIILALMTLSVLPWRPWKDWPASLIGLGLIFGAIYPLLCEVSVGSETLLELAFALWVLSLPLIIAGAIGVGFRLKKIKGAPVLLGIALIGLLLCLRINKEIIGAMGSGAC